MIFLSKVPYSESPSINATNSEDVEGNASLTSDEPWIGDLFLNALESFHLHSFTSRRLALLHFPHYKPLDIVGKKVGHKQTKNAIPPGAMSHVSTSFVVTHTSCAFYFLFQ